MINSCDRCARPIRLGWYAKDEVWKLVGAEWQNKMLCIECYLELLDMNIPVTRGWEGELDGQRVNYHARYPMRHFTTKQFRFWLNCMSATSERFGELTDGDKEAQ